MTSFQTDFRIRFSEVDRELRIMPTALFDLLQETAIRHSTSVSRGPRDLMERNVGWIMNRIHIQIDRYPLWNEEVSVATWPSNLKGLYAVREFEVRSATGLICCSATSRWLLIDLQRRRPIRIPDWIAGPYGVQSCRAIQDDFSDIPEIRDSSSTRSFHVRESDLDLNDHANSASYIDWSLESVLPDAVPGLLPAMIEIAYLREARAGEHLLAISRKDEDATFVHAIRRASDQAFLASGRSHWRPFD